MWGRKMQNYDPAASWTFVIQFAVPAWVSTVIDGFMISRTRPGPGVTFILLPMIINSSSQSCLSDLVRKKNVSHCLKWNENPLIKSYLPFPNRKILKKQQAFFVSSMLKPPKRSGLPRGERIILFKVPWKWNIRRYSERNIMVIKGCCAIRWYSSWQSAPLLYQLEHVTSCQMLRKSFSTVHGNFSCITVAPKAWWKRGEAPHPTNFLLFGLFKLA